jgi:hypothetical protein
MAGRGAFHDIRPAAGTGRRAERNRIRPKAVGAEDEVGLKGDKTGNPRKPAIELLLHVATERSEGEQDNP